MIYGEQRVRAGNRWAAAVDNDSVITSNPILDISDCQSAARSARKDDPIQGPMIIQGACAAGGHRERGIRAEVDALALWLGRDDRSVGRQPLANCEIAEVGHACGLDGGGG